jgi:hypothetical protein
VDIRISIRITHILSIYITDNNLSDEEAYLKFLAIYDVSIATLNKISSKVYPTLLHRQLICVASYIVNIIDYHSHEVARVV